MIRCTKINGGKWFIRKWKCTLTTYILRSDVSHFRLKCAKLLPWNLPWCMKFSSKAKCRSFYPYKGSIFLSRKVKNAYLKIVHIRISNNKQTSHSQQQMVWWYVWGFSFEESLTNKRTVFSQNCGSLQIKCTPNT